MGPDQGQDPMNNNNSKLFITGQIASYYLLCKVTMVI